MALPPTGPIDISLELFGGLNTEMAPSDLPEGASPDNQDVIYQPGGVLSRPCLSKVLSNPFVNAPQVVSAKKFLQANGSPLNLYMDALGNLAQEDPVAAQGVRTNIAAVVPGAYCKSCTIDGVEYMAFHDGVHGIDIPRQYDGTKFRRVSQEGPAVAPSAADYSTQVNIANANGIVPIFNTVNISAASENGNIVTITTATAHGYFTGNIVSVLGVTAAAYNGVWQVIATPDPFTFTYFNATGSLPAQGAGGTARAVTAKVTTTTPHGMIAGASFTIAGTSVSGYNNVGTTWTVQAVISATQFQFVPNIDPAVATGGTVQTGGQITVGTHQLAVCFLTDTGYITKPSPTTSWLAAGGRQVQITNLPIGPSNVVARILLFTGAGGASFFWISANTSGAVATIINDNTTTSVVLDFSDVTLFSSIAADIPGSNLFALVALAPCLGFVSYASRLLAYGEMNKVQGFLNLGFEGGTATVGGTNPLYWTIGGGGGGALVTNPADFGESWQITGDGTGNPRGLISQTAYQNYLNNFILGVSTKYSIYVWAKASAANLAGTLVFTLSSVNTGFSSTATINANAIPSANGAFVKADFTLATPAVIPSDLILSVQCLNLPNGATITIDEITPVFTQQPYRDTEFRCSYVNDFESFDGLTGTLGAAEDPNPIRDTAIIRQTLFILTGTAQGRLHQTTDNNAEPGTANGGWAVEELERNVGGVSPNCVMQGNNWFMWVADTGTNAALRIFGGGDSHKISREMKGAFSGLNMAAKKAIWAANDEYASRCYVGLPFGNSATPTKMAVLDYLELDTAEAISQSSSVHVSFTGKMIATDLARKWTLWNLPMSCGAVLARSATTDQMVFGSGADLRGPFGNVYTLDPTKLTDDDYGQMNPYYTTYFFVNHLMEQQLPVGNRKKLYNGFTIFVTGVGYLKLTPVVNRLGNELPALGGNLPLALSQSLSDDLIVPGEVSGRRVAFKVSVAPLPNTTDVQFALTHFGLSIQKHPVAPHGGQNRAA